MKKLLILVSILALAVMPAMAETQDVVQDNANVSITTGLPNDGVNHVIAIQMDNEPGARPQKGIASSDIIYESETYNGGYTRYTVVFNDTIPELAEAIRSTRIVHADIAMNYKGWFVHYGGQDMAGTNVFEYIKQVGLHDVDGLKSSFGSGYCYRDSNRSAPNNVVLKLGQLVQDLDWSDVNCTSPLKFSDSAYTQQGDNVNSFTVTYRSGSYEPSYEYHADDGLYYRSYNGNAFVDGDTGEQITCSNVIIMNVNYEWFLGDSDRPVVAQFGSNTCEYFIGGMHFTGTWQRDDVNDTTTYYDANGNEVLFKPGRTCIQLLSGSRSWQING